MQSCSFSQNPSPRLDNGSNGSFDPTSEPKPQLPPELAYEVIRYNRADRKELFKYFLVSKAWRSISISFLYHRAQMSIQGMPDLRYWQKMIIPSPEITEYIHKVVYATALPQILDYLCSLPLFSGAKQLEWNSKYNTEDASSVYHFLQRMPALESVTFVGLFPRTQELDTFLAHCGTSLTKLVFRSDFRFPVSRGEVGIGIQTFDRVHKHCDLSSLEHLEIHSISFDLIEYVVTTMDNSQALTNFRSLVVRPASWNLTILRVLMERISGFIESLTLIHDGFPINYQPGMDLFRRAADTRAIPRLTVGTESTAFSCHYLKLTGYSALTKLLRIANGNFITVELVFSASNADEITAAMDVSSFWRDLIALMVSQNPALEELAMKFHVNLYDETEKRTMETFVKERLTGYGFHVTRRVSVAWGPGAASEHWIWGIDDSDSDLELVPP
ncbi:hypothetical protein Moror_16815 [Moniliophthora roreri MCA 2997]|uniref:F-box domain-containing protein n=1 Tax=Moniliophthora roreri (strain MCA 2997) TaxID=1381753 RepID=V2WSF4_MONRO|nr:hypothetical protein Moror_16815 [Moniliophthora roreri MCA 2997]